MANPMAPAMVADSDITLAQLFELTNPTPTRALLYVRVSSLREQRQQGGEITTETQVDNGTRFATNQGIAVVDVVYDLNVSGRRDKFLKRKVLPTIERIKAGEADCVIVYNVSRWGRSAIENQLSEAMLWEVGGRLLSATEPNDEKTTAGKMTRQQLYTFAEFQSNTIGDSWRAAHANRLKKGLPRDGRQRFGYTYEKRSIGDASYTPDPVTREFLADAYQRYVDGEALWSLTQDARRKGITVPNDPMKLMTYRVLTNALDSGFGAGKIVVTNDSNKPTDYRYLPGTQEPVISQELWKAYLVKRRHDIENRVEQTRHPKLALQGLVRCGSCKRTLSAQRTDGYVKYACTGRARAVSSGSSPCDHPTSVRADAVNRAVMEWLRSFTMSTEALDQVRIERVAAAKRAEEDAADLEQQVTSLRSARTNYLRMRAAELITTDEELQEMLAEVDTQIEELEVKIIESNRVVKIHRLPEMDMFEATLAGWLSGMDEAIVNRGLAKAIKGVYIGKGTRSDIGNGKIDIIGTWEDREPTVFLAPIRNVDHAVGKFCSKCLEWKPADEFYRRKNGRDKGQLTSQCRECHKVYFRGYYQRTVEGQNVAVREEIKKDRRTVYEHGHHRGDQVRDKDGQTWTRGTKLWHQEGRPKQTKNGRTWDQLNQQLGPLTWLGTLES